ncbi:hypothetical protein KXW38_001425, partial [Aspergillus fumigatus]
DLGAGDPRADHRRPGPDLGQFHRAVRQRPRHPVAGRRAPGAAHRGRGAHRRSRPRSGLDREGRTRSLCRLDPGRHLHAGDLPSVRRVRQHRGRRQRRHDLRPFVAAQRHADAARHRRHRADHRHRGRFQ